MLTVLQHYSINDLLGSLYEHAVPIIGTKEKIGQNYAKRKSKLARLLE